MRTEQAQCLLHVDFVVIDSNPDGIQDLLSTHVTRAGNGAILQDVATAASSPPRPDQQAQPVSSNPVASNTLTDRCEGEEGHKACGMEHRSVAALDHYCNHDGLAAVAELQTGA